MCLPAARVGYRMLILHHWRFYFQGKCNQINKPQLKGEAGKGSKWPCAGGTETVKKKYLVLLKAKVSAVGNLHIFSWWEGDIL